MPLRKPDKSLRDSRSTCDLTKDRLWACVRTWLLFEIWSSVREGASGRPCRGKWRLDALLGFGGMAGVYAATHRNGKRVAIKMLHSIHAQNEEARVRFMREGYAANSVGHPGVVQVLDDDELEVEEPDGHAERFELRRVEHDDDDDIDEDALSELTLVDSTTNGRP